MRDIPAADENLLTRLPLPLAQLYRRACNAKAALDRHLMALSLWEASVKLLASAAVVRYARTGQPDEKLAQRIRKLARPALGDWWALARALLPILAQRGDAGYKPVCELLLADRPHDDLPRCVGLDVALVELLEQKKESRAAVKVQHLFDRMVQHRNQFTGHGSPAGWSAARHDALAGAILTGTTELLGRMDVLAEQRLIYVAEVRKAGGLWLVQRFELTGESARRLPTLELPRTAADESPDGDRVYLEGPSSTGKAADWVALHPLVVYDMESASTRFLNSRWGKQGKRQTEYLCYSTGVLDVRPDLGTAQCELLGRLLGIDIKVGSEQIEQWGEGLGLEEPVPEEGPTAAEPRYLGEYELERELGRGGMGVVYRAWQPSLRRHVALKRLKEQADDARALDRFRREIRALGKVDHPNLVKVIGAGSDGEHFYYSMELVEGAPLADVCGRLGSVSTGLVDIETWQQTLSTVCEESRRNEKPLGSSPSDPEQKSSPAAAKTETPSSAEPVRTPPTTRGLTTSSSYVRHMVELMRQIAEATHALHEGGVLHRDIKPGNILVTDDGTRAVLMDLGLAQLADDLEGRLTRTRQFVGTLRYASPEQVLAVGKMERTTDVYSLGATLWEVLSLAPLYGATEETPPPLVMRWIQQQEPDRLGRVNRAVARDLEAIVHKCLEKEERHRYATAHALSEDLGRFLDGRPVRARPVRSWERGWKWAKRRPVVAGLTSVAAALLLLSVLSAVWAANSFRSKAQAETKARIALEQRAAAEAQARSDLEEQLYENHIAVAERELALNQDVGLASQLLEQCPQELRGWEWDFLMRLRDGDRPALEGHTAGLWRAVFSPDGRHIATSSIDGTVRIWDADSGKHVWTYTGHDFVARLPRIVPKFITDDIPRVPVMCLAYSPDGKQIASGSFSPDLTDLTTLTKPREWHSQVKLWDPETHREILTFDKQMGLILSLAFSPDGTRIASSSANEHEGVLVWDTKSGAVIQEVPTTGGTAHQVRFSPDGKFLATSMTNGTVILWDAQTFDRVRTVKGHSAPVLDLAFSPDGSRMASAGFDGIICVWDTRTGEQVMPPLRGHQGATSCVAYSPDGKRIASGGFDKTVRVWDARNGREKITLRRHKDTVCGVDFSPDSRRLVSAGWDKVALVWDANPLEATSAPGLFTVHGNLEEGDGSDKLQSDHRVNSVAFSRDRRFVASGGWDGAVRLWNATTGAAVRTLGPHRGPVWCVTFSPDSRRLASASWDDTVKIWDVDSGRELLTFREHGYPVHAVAFSPKGDRLVSCSWDGRVKVWDGATGKVIAPCEGHPFPTLAVAFSPDGKRVASGSGDRSITVWDATTGKKLFTLKGHLGGVSGLAFSPDGKRLASASWDHTFRIWNVDPDAKSSSKHQSVLVVQAHDDRVNALAFSPDGAWIATASDDKRVRVWDATTGKEAAPPRRHRGPVWSVAFSPDGERLVVGCWSDASWVKTWPSGK